MIPLSERNWISLGDLEASYDGCHYVDVRAKDNNSHRFFLSEKAIKKVMALFHESPFVPWTDEDDASQ